MTPGAPGAPGLSPRRAALVVLAAAIVPWAAGLAWRPLLPIDETRYLSVAWEMWRGHDLLVPHLNGAPYSDKPPLLFWLILAGWRVFGVAEWWARLIPVVSGLAAAWLTASIARALWPGRPATAPVAAVVLAGTLPWAVFTQVVMFDALLTVTVLAALLGLLHAAHGRPGGFALAAFGLGAGLLTKGPAVLLHVLPVALLAPWWNRSRFRPAWYAGLGAALLGGLAIVLAWAIPAARHGGPSYAGAILVRQTAGRVVHSFAHRHPVWWYLPLLPVLLLPWVAWPAAWHAVRRLPRGDDGLRFLAAWAIPAFIGFSLVSGKQPYYLLPLLPAAALGLARALDGVPTARLAPRVSLGIGLALSLALAGVRLTAPRILAAEDLRPWAREFAALEQDGYTIAHDGAYAGQFHFLGRLTRPFVVLPEHGDGRWVLEAPGRALVTYERQAGAGRCPAGARHLSDGPYRGHYLCISLSPDPPPSHRRAVK